MQTTQSFHFAQTMQKMELNVKNKQNSKFYFKFTCKRQQIRIGNYCIIVVITLSFFNSMRRMRRYGTVTGKKKKISFTLTVLRLAKLLLPIHQEYDRSINLDRTQKLNLKTMELNTFLSFFISKHNENEIVNVSRQFFPISTKSCFFTTKFVFIFMSIDMII